MGQAKGHDIPLLESWTCVDPRQEGAEVKVRRKGEAAEIFYPGFSSATAEHRPGWLRNSG